MLVRSFVGHHTNLTRIVSSKQYPPIYLKFSDTQKSFTEDKIKLR